MSTEAEEITEAASAEVAAEEPESEEPAEGKTTAPPTASRGRLPITRRGLAIAATALVVLTLLVTAVLQWRDADRLRSSERTDQQVRTRAAEFGQALLAYRHADLPSAKAKIISLTSSDFGKNYETAFGSLAEVIGKYKADATATVRDVYVNDIDGQRARSLVVLDSEVRSTVGVRTVVGTKLLLQLILEHGAWKVDAMSNLPADDETLTKPDGTTERPTASPSAAATP